MSDTQENASFGELQRHFSDCGQGHVFRFWETLSPPQRERLAKQAAGIDLSALAEAFQKTRQSSEDSQPVQLRPPSVVSHPERGGDEQAWQEARTHGDVLLRAGRVAAFAVAGGQGTRLGFPGPKGAFPIGPISERCLFELQAQRIRGLRRRYEVEMPWYIMTSYATDAATRELFESNAYFGLPPEDVFFFCQGTAASVDFNGKLILEAPDRIFESPDGHGGSLIALARSGALDDMEKRGIDLIFYYQVDNPLAQIGNPALLGVHDRDAAEMSCLVVSKSTPEEKLGLIAEINGALGIIEYTEIDDEHSHARDESGELVYWAGNIAIHVLQRQFVERVAQDADRHLPFHASAKKIPFIDEDGNAVIPSEPNGYKFERFVFDALPLAKPVSVVETLRRDEFSPVKNAEGLDSPATAREDLSEFYRRWLEASGMQAEGAIEIDESRISSPEDIRKLGIESIAEMGDAIRQAAGVRQ